jgi:hypothetical protein
MKAPLLQPGENEGMTDDEARLAKLGCKPRKGPTVS